MSPIRRCNVLCRMPLATCTNSWSLEPKTLPNTSVRCSLGNATPSAGMIRQLSSITPSPTAASRTANSPVFATPMSTADGSELSCLPKVSQGCVTADQSRRKATTL